MRKKFLHYMLCISLLVSCCVCSLAWADVSIDKSIFPDDVFRSHVTVFFDTDKDARLSDSEIAKVTKMDLAKASSPNIESLEGIQYFTALTELECQNLKLTSLDMSQNLLLETLLCYNNNIQFLNISGNTNLSLLNCGKNSLEALDVSNNTKLESLYCQENKLTSLNTTKNTELINLYCSNNRLRELDISKNQELKFLQIQKNRFTTFDATVRPDLTSITCNGQEVSIETLSEDEYGFQLAFSVLSLRREMFPPNSPVMVRDIQAFDSAGKSIDVEARVDNEIFYFDVRPSTLKYNYNVGYDDPLMDVTVKFGKNDDDDDNPTPVTGGTGGGGGGGCDSGFGFMGLIFVSAIAFRKRK